MACKKDKVDFIFYNEANVNNSYGLQNSGCNEYWTCTFKSGRHRKGFAFYRHLLGFRVTQWYGDSAVFLSAGGYHHHIGLNTWHSKNAAPVRAAGLYLVAILYPTEKDLATIGQRLLEADYPLTGASDHGVSKAIYLNDPDGNGVELYWDRPKEEWPVDEKGNLLMGTEALDMQELFATLQT